MTITVNPISTVNAISDTVCSGDIVPQIDFIEIIQVQFILGLMIIAQ